MAVTKLCALLVDLGLDIDRHGGRALIEDAVGRTVEEEARHCYALLLSTTQHVKPVPA